jgi:UDP-N-acetyl-D-galactosamine dehydrogenase
MDRIISITGLGYVGLPLAAAFARAGYRVIGFDLDESRVSQLRSGHDRNGEVDPCELRTPELSFHNSPDALKQANFHVVAVPTPVTPSHQPDLEPLLSATSIIGAQLRPGAIVSYESTVFPGATETCCIPILESESRLKSGLDFHVGYSPERINPGDAEHRLESTVKIVAAQNEQTTEILADVYGKVTKRGIHRAPNIRTAEAAKVIENIQRDLNIALINELATIFHRLDIDTGDVLEAAGTKWNFIPFRPGLVGGHCIGVDPYYMTFRAEQLGFHPEVILAGRRCNDTMHSYIARETIRRIVHNGLSGSPIVTVLGMTYKEDVRDVRNSRVPGLVAELRRYGASVQVSDPICDPHVVNDEYGLQVSDIDDVEPADAVVLAVPHRTYRERGWSLVQRLLKNGRGLIIDVKSCLARQACPQGVLLWRI